MEVPALGFYPSGVISPGHLLAFTIAAFIVIAIPGPSVLFAVSRALTLGRRGALLSVAGNSIGVYLQVAAVALGLGVIVERSIVVYTVVKLVGAVYLVYLGINAIRHRRAFVDPAAAPLATKRPARMLWDGIVVGVANPKVIVFFAAVLPQFVDRGAGHLPVQMLLLGLVFIAIGFVSDSAWGFAASTARTWLSRSPKRLEKVGAVGGVAMIGLGAGLALSGVKD